MAEAADSGGGGRGGDRRGGLEGRFGSGLRESLGFAFLCYRAAWWPVEVGGFWTEKRGSSGSSRRRRRESGK